MTSQASTSRRSSLRNSVSLQAANANNPKSRPKLEVCCFSYNAAAQAFSTTVPSRIEMCASDTQGCGGLTPSELLPITKFELLRKLNRVCPVRIMIRPHGERPIYSYDHFLDMRDDITRFAGLAEHGNAVDSGVVFGILEGPGERESMVDLERCKALVAQAHRLGLRCTFHRAFDDIKDKVAALEDVISCGFDSLLTAGGTDGAAANVDVLEQLVQQAAGRIEIVVGGGVRSSNLDVLLNTGAKMFHTSAITYGSDMPDLRELELMRVIIRGWYNARVPDHEQID